MKVDRISYKRNFLIDPFTMEHEHIGIELQLDNHDEPSEVYAYAKGLVEGLHEKSFPVVDADKKYSVFKEWIESTEFREDAENQIKLSDYNNVLELKSIAKQKPSKP